MKTSRRTAAGGRMFAEWLWLVPAALMGTALVLVAAPLGCLVLWRRLAFFAETLAHGALLGLSLAAWWGLPLWLGMLGTALVLVALLLRLHDARLPMESLLALCSTTLLCGGWLLLAGLPTQRAQINGYLFGDLLALDWRALGGPLAGCAVLLLMLWRVWPQQMAMAIDEDLAASTGLHATLQRLLLLGLVAGFTLLAVKAVGSLLVGALLVIPALSARLPARSPRSMVLWAGAIGLAGLWAGLGASVVLDVATGPAVVLAMAAGFLVIWGVQGFFKN